MEAKVEIISRELIKPSNPTPHHLKVHKLSLVDQFLDDVFAPFLLFYQNSNINVVHPCKTSHHLKQSLADTLTKFYPLAGKLTVNPEGFSVVDCDDSGALFVEAKVGDPLRQSLDDEKVLQYLPFDPYSVDEPLLGKYPRNETMLAVQITHFECGGSAVGICISHGLVDLASMLTFLSSWAAMNRGSESEILVKFDLGSQLFPPVEQHARPPRDEVKDDRKLALKKFVFNKEMLINLKQLASMSQTLKDPSRVEVVTAFLWKQFMKVTSTLSQSSAPETKFTFKAGHMVNLRGRISTLSYHDADDVYHFGNLALYTATDSFSATTKEIVGDGAGGIDFGELVGLIRRAIRKVDDEFVLSYRNVPRTVNEETHWQNFVSFCRCPTNEVDFGWGKPCLVGPGCTDYPDVKLLEEIEAWVTMFEDEMASLPSELLKLQATHLFHLNS